MVRSPPVNVNKNLKDASDMGPGQHTAVAIRCSPVVGRVGRGPREDSEGIDEGGELAAAARLV